MMEEIQTKIKQKRQVYDAMSGKRKSFPISLPVVPSSIWNPNVYNLNAFCSIHRYLIEVDCSSGQFKSAKLEDK